MSRQGEKRSSLLTATLELIAEQGFHATPMSQIAGRANVGIGTIYRYFAGKEDLVNALYIETKRRILQFSTTGYDEGAPVHEGVCYLVRRTIQYLSSHPSEMLFAEQYEHSPLIRSATRREYTGEPLLSLLKRGIDEGTLKPLPLEMIGALIGGPVFSLAKMYSQGVIEPGEDSLSAAVEAIWDSIER